MIRRMKSPFWHTRPEVGATCIFPLTPYVFSVDEAGQEKLARDIDDARPSGNVRVSFGANGHKLAVFNDDRGVVDVFRGVPEIRDINDRSADKGEDLL